MPTVKEMEQVWDLPPAPEIPEDETKEAKLERQNSPEQKKYDRAVKILVWWMDSFMPYAVGLEFWGPNIRPFHLMTDKQFIEGDVSGVEKVLVTTTSEAFAYVLFKNCLTKWIADYQLKKKNKKATIPTYKKDNPSTHQHQNKWSNANSGSIPGGGWHRDALVYFKERMTAVGDFREKEEKDGFPNYKLAQQLIRIHTVNDIKMDGEETEPPSKKRKRDDEVADKSEDDFELIILDE